MGHQKEINVDNFRDKLSSWARQNGADPEQALAALGTLNSAQRWIGIIRTPSRAGSPVLPPRLWTASRSSRQSSTKKLRRLSRRQPVAAEDRRPVALITGASRGIGRAIALELHSTHRIVGTYRGRRDAAESLAAETGAAICACDLARRDDREALVSFVTTSLGVWIFL